MTACSMRHLIDRHFARRIRPAEETKLRQHLPTCEACDSYYDRHLLFAGLDPVAPSAEERLATGLGLSLPGKPVTTMPRAPVFAAAVAVAAGLALFLARPRDPGADFQARGTGVESRVWAYRVAAGAKPVELGDVMSPNDELAFAIDNPAEARRLLLFGVDEHRHVYWYHPAWVDPAKTPSAVPVPMGRHELPEAVSHSLDGGMLTLYAVLTNDGVTVRDAERELDAYTRRASWQQKVRVLR